MLAKALKAFLSHPLARSVDLDSAEYHLIRARIIQQKTLLKRIYLNWYRRLEKSIPQNTGGIVIEIGSSAGFSKQVIRGVVTSDIVDTPLSRIKFPKGALIGAIVRGDEIIIPRGQSVIKCKDRLIIFALRKVIPKLEKLLTVKLDYF